MHDDFRNRLIWGDSKLVMASLLKDFRGKIDLIYIDPTLGCSEMSTSPIRKRSLWIERWRGKP
jgi:adenine-specific DNA-methyltransferase